ncbi:nucleotidyltransferase domain-containing protein [Candidatus Curtissbacteria bacterium]|nr:nucleotidyltransferase domain-containing protein [Candidatus Curtissbacteria bacterium]
MNDTQAIVDQLKKFKPQAVILFGSAAWGGMKEGSDLDLLVVLDSDKPFTDRMRDLRTQISTNVPLDLIVLTPKEARDFPKKSTFFSQIMKEGKLLYGRI